jgi:hypothetical protein
MRAGTTFRFRVENCEILVPYLRFLKLFI